MRSRLVAVVGTTYWLVFSRLRAEGVARQFATRVMVLMVAALPGVLYDLVRADTSGLRVYPLMYCIGSVVLTSRLVHLPRAAQRRPPTPTLG